MRRKLIAAAAAVALAIPAGSALAAPNPSAQCVGEPVSTLARTAGGAFIAQTARDKSLQTYIHLCHGH